MKYFLQPNHETKEVEIRVENNKGHLECVIRGENTLFISSDWGNITPAEAYTALYTHTAEGENIIQ